MSLSGLGVEASNLTSATDEKLKVYCSVLKEQIDDMRFQTLSLVEQPQYGVLTRFMNFWGLVANPIHVKMELEEELDRFREMLSLLEVGGPQRRRIFNRWAHEHIRRVREDARRF